MKPIGGAWAIGVALLAATAASAQTAEFVGKVQDGDGKPVAGAALTVSSATFKDRVYKGTADKKGAYFITGVLVSEQSPVYTVAVAAEGFVPAKASILARTGDKTRYFDDERTLSAKTTSVEVKARALAEIRVDFTMRTGDAAAELAEAAGLPPPAAAAVPGATPEAAAALPGAAAGGAPDDYMLAIAKVRGGDAEGSVDLFKKAIEAKPDDWERRDVFAKVLLKLDRQGEATIQANKAAALAPDKAGPLVTLSDIYTARGLPDKASDAITKAEQLEPDNVKVTERAAAIAAQSGKIDEAIALNEKVLAKNPNNTEVLVALADLYSRKKLPKKAEEMLARVVDLDPKNAYRTFYNLGVVIENRDDLTDADHRKAIEAFRKSIDLRPDYALAHRDLGLALLRKGDLPEARKELQKYVDLNPQARDAPDIKDTIKSLASAK
jgi:tetratricopeptide (TPR) repeat protein